jgi:hypothetical protein
MSRDITGCPRQVGERHGHAPRQGLGWIQVPWCRNYSARFFRGQTNPDDYQQEGNSYRSASHFPPLFRDCVHSRVLLSTAARTLDH